jgi:predicted TPR repeat methyltransferase
MAQRPISLENAMALAKQSAEKGDVAAARNLYKKVLESDPGYKPARKALTLSGDHEDAFAVFDKALALNPNDAIALTFKGNLLLEAYKLGDARKCIERALEIDPSHSSDSARFAITTELRTEGDIDMELRASGRYAHSNGYVERVAAEQGFEIEAYATAPLRKEYKEWLEGGFYILKAAAKG